MIPYRGPLSAYAQHMTDLMEELSNASFLVSEDLHGGGESIVDRIGIIPSELCGRFLMAPCP